MSAYKKLGILPGTVLAVRNGILITEDEPLLEDDLVELILVNSGG